MPSIVARPSSLGSRIGETASIGPGPAHPHCARFASDPVGGSAHGNIAGGPTRATSRYDVTVASRPGLMPRGWPLLDGETLVRNLEQGMRRATELGRVMAIGYLPDMFGHVAQMPQLLRRAGIEDAVVWRGVPAAIDRHVFAWTAPDGSTVRCEYLLGGYGNGRGVLSLPDRIGDKLDGYVP